MDAYSSIIADVGHIMGARIIRLCTGTWKLELPLLLRFGVFFLFFLQVFWSVFTPGIPSHYSSSYGTVWEWHDTLRQHLRCEIQRYNCFSKDVQGIQVQRPTVVSSSVFRRHWPHPLFPLVPGYLSSFLLRKAASRLSFTWFRRSYSTIGIHSWRRDTRRL